MTNTVRRWRLLVGCAAVAAAGLGGPVAGADPLQPVQPNPYGPAAQPASQPAAVPATAPLQGVPRLVAPGPAAPGPAAVPGYPAAAPAPVPQSALLPATSGTLRDYFAAKKVQLEPQQATGFTAFNITLPMPAGWSHVPDPNVPDAFAVIADRRGGSLYTPNAQVVVYRLVGQFDPKEAITHGFVDSQQMMAWQTTNASLAEFNGFPSSVIEGTYRDADMTLNTSRRHVIVPADGSSYLVSLTVTTGAGRAVGNAPATDGIINGFHVGPRDAEPAGVTHLPDAPHGPAPAVPAQPRAGAAG
ncbi:LpqN/LpqT family lipoprotein [[Mycobacterium] nativiensis]|uniref:LpqN/LpqT family lipoprotein n=1 Tax=[Mycobacterium] nativiensis TaxID=2855503 RepID=A0ABU5Y1F5_9MYCO|nr:LpqN/LpqT family lipoprotein [Mycolicibacter sp. MYC340]MEB3033958.1 LpqN/LpqT family lipoprotein [Mycolicibacter sp. MYC340]